VERVNCGKTDGWRSIHLRDRKLIIQLEDLKINNLEIYQSITAGYDGLGSIIHPWNPDKPGVILYEQALKLVNSWK
jgi:hypothetical protein